MRASVSYRDASIISSKIVFLVTLLFHYWQYLQKYTKKKRNRSALENTPYRYLHLTFNMLGFYLTTLQFKKKYVKESETSSR